MKMVTNIKDVIQHAKYYDKREIEKYYNMEEIERIEYTIRNSNFGILGVLDVYMDDRDDTLHNGVEYIQGIFDISELAHNDSTEDYTPLLNNKQYINITRKVIQGMSKAKYIIEPHDVGFLIINRDTHEIVNSCVYWYKFIDRTYRGSCWKSERTELTKDELQVLFEGTVMDNINFFENREPDFMARSQYHHETNSMTFKGDNLKCIIDLLFLNNITQYPYYDTPDILQKKKHRIPKDMTIGEAEEILNF